MSSVPSRAVWNFDSAISLLKSLQTCENPDFSGDVAPLHPDEETEQHSTSNENHALGDFSSLWQYFGHSREPQDDHALQEEISVLNEDESALDQIPPGKGVHWRDEYDGADLEDNVEPEQISASNLRTRKRAARRARQREREAATDTRWRAVLSDTATDAESGEELEKLRRSPDRRAIISEIIGRPRPGPNISPPTSPSPPKDKQRTTAKSDWPVSNPFIWNPDNVLPSSRRVTIAPRDGLTPAQRKAKLITRLALDYPDEKKYLVNGSLTEPAFTPLNVSSLGIHVFVDMSNISIGFHDCLKVVRGIPITTRVPRIPLNFHNLSLVLERGRPAAKRTLVGSDRTRAIDQAERLGYEANILDRVHKAKQLTPRQKKYHRYQSNGSGYGTAGSASGLGDTSGSETNTHRGGGGLFTSNPLAATAAAAATFHAATGAKYHEQGVDEILHLKMMESIVDAERPGTIVLATGDAAEAEYSAGFLKMAERALRHGWMVELVSFKLNTSSLYKRKEFRDQWGPMFRWVQLDDYAEMLMDQDEDY